MSKIAGKNLSFKANVAGIKTHWLIDNRSEAELIDESFVRTNKISIFKIKTQIRLKLSNEEMVKWLDKACLVDIQIGNHQKQLFCYMTKLNIYFIVLEDSWLKQHNSAID